MAEDKGGFELIMREGVDPATVVGKPAPPPPVYDIRRQDGMVIERNLAVKLRDGVTIYVDVYRPDGPAGEKDLGVILGWSPYGKQNLSDSLFPGSGVEPGWMSKYTAFEAPDPLYFVPKGYAVCFADPRGNWYSEGEFRHHGQGEAEDCYDLIEWLGVQPWSNGKVGMIGVSYLAAIQWLTGPLKPPHLAALCPWEGFSDFYREFAFHGGIPETSFLPRGSANLIYSTTRVEDTPANVAAHPLFDAFWESKVFHLEGIETPILVVASWSDQGFHTRGTLEGFKKAASPQKWLRVHGRKKWADFYEPASKALQVQFFDRFLLGKDSGFEKRPKVELEVRERAWVGQMRAENEWPLARTVYRKLFLDAVRGELSEAPLPASDDVRYDARTGQAVFDHKFAEDTELTGHMKLRLWLEAEGADDADVFVAIQKLDADGAHVGFVFYAIYDNGPVALGWLRASHRELDEARSTPEQPVHPHTREEPLPKGEPVPLEIEIWPSSTLFRAGETLRVVVAGHDVYQVPPPALFGRHEDTRNAGTHVVWAGGPYDSHLLVPVIPAKEA